LSTTKRLETTERKRKEKLAREHKLINKVDYKSCSLHHTFFPEEDLWFPSTEEFFYKSNMNKTDGLNPYCKKCAIEKAMIWKANNPEKYKIADIKRQLVPKRVKYNRDWAKGQKKSGYYSEYIKRPEVKARKYGDNHRQHDISTKEWNACNDYFKDGDGDQSCAYCGLKLQDHYYTRLGVTKNGNFHKEHVIHDGANDLSNCVPSCKDCNSSKWTFTFEDWYREQTFFDVVRYNKIILWVTEDYKKYIRDKVNS